MKKKIMARLEPLWRAILVQLLYIDIASIVDELVTETSPIPSSSSQLTQRAMSPTLQNNDV
jgi:hypothetical protein